MSTSLLQPIKVGQYHGYGITYKSSQLQVISDLGCNPNILILDGQKVLDTNTQSSDLRQNILSKGNFLAPFPNRIADGKYTFEGNAHQLEINEKERGNALHGLIFQRPFTLHASAECNKGIIATFKTQISKNNFKGYPFAIEILISFILKEKELRIGMIGNNIGTTNAPFGVGWHPYMTTGKNIDNLHLTLPARSILETDQGKELIPTGNKLPNDFGTKKRRIGDCCFDTCFTDLERQSVHFENIELFMDTKMQYVQIYTPEHRTAIAIEPMSCAPNAFNNGMGLEVLKPQESISYHFGIVIN